ncbi:unnamed protein product [Diplocarpon coronariae]
MSPPSHLPRKAADGLMSDIPLFEGRTELKSILKSAMEICLEYIDLWLARWPHKAKGGGTRSDEDKGQSIHLETKKVCYLLGTQSHKIAQLSAASNIPKQALGKNGKTRSINTFNFSIAELQEVIPRAKGIPISCDQTEIPPWPDGILTICYTPFAGDLQLQKLSARDVKALDSLATPNGGGRTVDFATDTGSQASPGLE